MKYQIIGIILVGFAVLFILDVLNKLGITNTYITFAITITVCFVAAEVVGNLLSKRM